MFTALLLTLASTTSGASSGPDLEERAAAVDLPVERVMVFSDRARVTRSGHVKVTPGVAVVRLPDLPGSVMLDTVRVSAEGAKVVRVETQPIERERWSIDQVDAWLADLEKISDQIAISQGKLQTARNELAMLSNLDAAPPVPEKDRLGKPVPPLAPENWRALLDHLAQRRAAARVVEKRLERELRDQSLQYSKAQREVQKRDLGGFSDKKIEVLVILEAVRADPVVTAEYAVPGASWKPAYDLSFDPDANKVELKASGLVTQSTGEDWPNSKLAFSTAIPGMGIDMPELQTWTLGDDREYIPRATARTPPRNQHPFQAPARKPRVAELERDADRSLLQSRSQLLLAMARQPVTSRPRVTVDTTSVSQGITFSGEEIDGSLADEGGGFAVSGSEQLQLGRRNISPSPTLAPPPAPPVSVSRAPSRKESAAKDDEDYDMPMATTESAPSSSSSVVTKALGGLARLTDSITGGEAQTSWKSLPLYQGIAWQRPSFADPMLPAVTAGGLDYVYDAPVATTVPSQAQQLRVPLATRSYDVSTFYEATPSLATTAYLKASVKNGSKLPILAGAANVFVKGTFSGDAILATTGPGGALELPLGADENIRLTRTVIPATTTQGFIFGQEDVTEYSVKVDVGNYKKHAITLRVIDQIPKTNEEKVKVELLASSPKAEEEPNGEGLLYWHIDVPAGATKTLTFSYRIIRPKGWRLTQ